jgi:hypothetical protein
MVSKPTGTPARAAVLGSALVERATWLIELGVGIACVAGGLVAVRRPPLRIVGVALLVAGLAAAAHASLRLAPG